MLIVKLMLIVHPVLELKGLSALKENVDGPECRTHSMSLILKIVQLHHALKNEIFHWKKQICNIHFAKLFYSYQSLYFIYFFNFTDLAVRGVHGLGKPKKPVKPTQKSGLGWVIERIWF